ncbi:methyltransferase family protein [Effusibacillus lacus]|uniref:Isoprenylcysteine carboxyl methyltransferase n=1 Tax=Effusibacillus lacus TaxID=1348429 RepID=A0A292YSF7_9BACL|nr:isoprenylcysteine carboxylmethyltransferase family protein [Effusibacillus lacus]TCS75908.1 protein-S-isoprenylcysteine O-methyltransferase Ste14 [Effusibacillus lacus]GAX91703.1 isoprenylcysteine carboxyl methyltransferase [Effusibacillus lacus]
MDNSLIPQSGVLWGRWDLVIISIIVHLVVLFFFISSSFLKPKKVDFRSKGILVGFVIALYFEMYGIPLTIFLLQPLMSEFLMHFYPVPFAIRFIGSVLIFLGFVIIYLGWKKIHSRGNEVIKTGIYSYVRHPQYIGLMLLTLGQVVQWPTITGIILWPLLLVIYYKLALHEEKDVETRFGEEYQQYKAEVPGFFPKLNLGFLSWRHKEKTL